MGCDTFSYVSSGLRSLRVPVESKNLKFHYYTTRISVAASLNCDSCSIAVPDSE